MSYSSGQSSSSSSASGGPGRSFSSSRSLMSSRLSMSVSTRSMARLASSSSENAQPPHAGSMGPPRTIKGVRSQYVTSTRLTSLATTDAKSRVAATASGSSVSSSSIAAGKDGAAADRISAAGMRTRSAKRKPLTVLANRSSNIASSSASASSQQISTSKSTYALGDLPKRKSAGDSDRPRKMVRLDRSDSGNVPRPSVISNPDNAAPITPTKTLPASRIPVRTPFMTPTRPAPTSMPGSVKPAPTPARDILKRKPVGDDEDMDNDDDDEDEPIIARPPTPPRLHDRTPFRAFRSRVEAADLAEMVEDAEMEATVSTTPTMEPPLHAASTHDPSSAKSLRQTTLPFARLSTNNLLSPSHNGPIARNIDEPSHPTSSSGGINKGIYRISTPPRASPTRRAIGSPGARSPIRSTAILPQPLSRRTSHGRSTTPTDDVPLVLRDSADAAAMEVDDSAGQLAAASQSAVSDASRSSLMPPPSRIPTFRSRRNLQAEAAAPSMSINAAPAPEASARKSAGLSSLPTRRPVSRPTMTSGRPGVVAVTTATAPRSVPGSMGAGLASEPAGVPAKRKPSYPSSLSLGPVPGSSQPRQTPRMVTSPVPLHMLDPAGSSSYSSSSSSGMDVDALGPAARPSPRSVSEPAPRPRTSLNMSYRREGWGATNQSLVGLEAALERLKMPKIKVERPPSRSSETFAMDTYADTTPRTAAVDRGAPDQGPAATTSILTASARLSSVHRSRFSLASAASGTEDHAPCGDISMAGDDHAGDQSIAAIITSNQASGCLKGVVAFVDAWTEEGADSSKVFGEVMRRLGARVLTRPTESCTHIVYKGGKPSTLAWWRKQEDPPHIVGISWVMQSKKAGKRLDEEPYRVKPEDEDVFQKRRKSMEPKSISLAATTSTRSGLLSVSISEAKRKSLLHAPRVSSPLKKGYRRYDSDDDA